MEPQAHYQPNAAPPALQDLAPRAVIITNHAYRIEIAAHLERLGAAADLMVA